MNQTVQVAVRGLWAWSFTLLFVYLKLTGQIDWNWFLVLSPVIAKIMLGQALGFYVAYKTNKMENETDDEKPNTGGPIGFGHGHGQYI